MNTKYKAIFRITGLVLCIQAMVLAVPAASALYWGELRCLVSFLISAAISLAIGLPLRLCLKEEKDTLTTRDALITILFVWVCITLDSALPYLMSGHHTSFASALFESVSSWTTTGATAFPNVAALPQSISLWRNFSQWLGGAGILVMLTLLLRGMGGSSTLMKLEAPGIVMSENSGRYLVLAKKLAITYVVLSGIQFILLLLGGCGPFDAMIITFSSCATGGATCYHSSLVSFSPYVQLVSAVFMILSSMNLVLIGGVFLGETEKMKNSSETKLYPMVMAVAAVVVIADLRLTGTYETLSEAIRYGGFQTVSFASTCGLYNANFENWPTLCKSILSFMTFAGGCSMSTSGAIKIFRIIILIKLLKRSFTTRLHPTAVKAVTLNGKALSAQVTNSVVSFFFTYMVVFLAGVFIISFESPDMQSAFTSAASLLNNIGAGFGAMGANGCYAEYGPFMKIFMCLLMLAGRLELYPVILPFTGTFYKKQ
ncbi:MAG: hypothetical protein MJ194_01070 [Clostridia bacterium]|nr:hypothetical protein [Clostridia bacterium]